MSFATGGLLLLPFGSGVCPRPGADGSTSTFANIETELALRLSSRLFIARIARFDYDLGFDPRVYRVLRRTLSQLPRCKIIDLEGYARPSRSLSPMAAEAVG